MPAGGQSSRAQVGSACRMHKKEAANFGLAAPLRFRRVPYLAAERPAPVNKLRLVRDNEQVLSRYLVVRKFQHEPMFATICRWRIDVGFQC